MDSQPNTEPREIPIDTDTAGDLRQLQGSIHKVQSQIVELVVVLAAYGALPASLQQAAQQLAQASQTRDDKIKKIAALAGVDLDSPDEAGQWQWNPAEGVLRKG